MTEIQLKGTKALVTGASSGLGLAMAEALLDRGASVVLTSRSKSKLQPIVQRYRASGLDAYGLALDVRDIDSIDATVQWVKREWGKLDVLVNNAGIGMRTVNPKFMFEPQPFFEVSPEGFRDVIDTNLTGYFLVSRAFTPLFVEQKSGKIINISINRETMVRKGFVPYGPSRAATDSLSYIMAEDLRPYGVTVNILLPGGATETGMLPEEYKDTWKSIPGLLKPDIMAQPIVFLASHLSDNLTGERIVAREFAEWMSERGIKPFD
ncbi:SDR family NAD(P)-dependent oxidoreductase [Alicyclobacillus acidiphilus]|uniref:SDR family NAD(P)-dependent oxidoreductase n=1 Tax=Alicyclobacillus acidiphilus TaxID=182455 RepID=UPI00082D508B|nr:SDR family oxidoreductase [Alicyclobacillus acidiphilus]